MITDHTIETMARRLGDVPGVVGVSLGGSRARGDSSPLSDTDLGIYYDREVDTLALGRLAQDISGERVAIARPGDWGPWVNGGAWLRIDGTQVDWVLRDLDKVEAQWRRALRGEYAFHPQPGHPLGFLDVSYVGELALGKILADPTGRLSETRSRMRIYPPALSQAIMAGLWEADFLLDAATKGTLRDDSTYVFQCLSRALMLCAHALYAREGVWVTNEKGLVPGVDRLRGAPEGFAARAASAFDASGSRTAKLVAAIRIVRQLVLDTRQVVQDGSAARSA